ncbi:type II toxin-antitoxin system RelE/ParE family toxin [Chamaesiphon sp. OTE_75_metabat_556]|uniref:type II toxin-antitoxin system RelE/ParE family toxin n=1 Tax=Chamaesiphon sp. OTE_75_metabat_556 TaxID=2964692 RepID=UPI00286B8D2E|nr:type II toxin-antitoxin system RelE/ParE family toxin [Chamaesiphon sp. OTE_75_metabat_556]
MPETRVIFYQDEKGKVPVLDWLDELERKDPKGLINCLDRIQQLASMGHELRRPLADFLRDGIYELRASHRRLQYRILYFFHGRNIAIIAHAIVKEDAAVPDVDIDRAIERQCLFVADPTKHTYQEEQPDGEN